MRRATLPFLLLFLATGAAAHPVEEAAESFAERTLGGGEAWETRAFLRDSGREGPTVFLVGGIHGNEPAGALAAEQIRHWPLARGRLVVLPRANVRALGARRRYTPGVPQAARNLNRNFPAAGEGEAASDGPRGPLAAAIWALVREVEPDWLLDLHEGFAPHRINAASAGHSVIVCREQAEARKAGDLALEAVNATFPEAARHFVRLWQTTPSTLARSAADHLGVNTLILETCFAKIPLSRRVHRHRVMVHAVLSHLGLLAADARATQVLPPRTSAAELRLALYDAEGTGGPGVPRTLQQVGGREATTVVRVCPEDVRDGVLDGFDVIAFTGGSGSRQAGALGEDGRRAVRTFVREGGGYVGICAGAYLATGGFSWGLGILDAKTPSSRWKRGRGPVEVELTDEGRRTLGERTSPFDVGYQNGPILVPLGRDDIPDYAVWAVYRTEVAENETPAGIMVGSPAIAAGTFGAGRVVVIGPHPEQTKGLEDVLPSCVDWAAGR